jgi:hypothetical protein
MLHQDETAVQHRKTVIIQTSSLCYHSIYYCPFLALPTNLPYIPAYTIIQYILHTIYTSFGIAAADSLLLGSLR